MKILIFGLSGSGKSTLAEKLHEELGYPRINGDDIRNTYNDWDFSVDGRIRQAERISNIAYHLDDCIIDIIAPLKQMRDEVDADFVIFMDTNTESEFKDTDAMFERPSHLEPRLNITDWNYDVKNIAQLIKITTTIKENNE